MKRLIILGAGGQGKVVADIAKLNGYEDIAFLDDNANIKECAGWRVLGPNSMATEIEGDVFVAIGDNRIRKEITQRYQERTFPTLVHPSSVIAKGIEIGAGTVVMAGTVINPGARIGDGVIVNTCSSIDHDCVVEDYCHISVGAHLCGTVKIGKGTLIGAGSTVSNNISICSECLIGVGAVVINDIQIPGTYIGIPAMVKRKD